jgi:hypothetical protein
MITKGVSMVLFQNQGLGLDDASHALKARGLTVMGHGDELVVRWGDGPMLRVLLARDPAVRQEALEIARLTAVAGLGQCDARFEIVCADLDVALDEINTLIETQATLQQLTGGFLFNTWNSELLPPHD